MDFGGNVLDSARPVSFVLVACRRSKLATQLSFKLLLLARNLALVAAILKSCGTYLTHVSLNSPECQRRTRGRPTAIPENDRASPTDCRRRLLSSSALGGSCTALRLRGLAGLPYERRAARCVQIVPKPTLKQLLFGGRTQSLLWHICC